MITDQNSKGYKIAAKCAELFKTDGKLAATKYYEKEVLNQPLWVKLSIADTFHELIK